MITEEQEDSKLFLKFLGLKRKETASISSLTMQSNGIRIAVTTHRKKFKLLHLHVSNHFLPYYLLIL